MSVDRLRVTDDRLAGRRIVVVATVRRPTAADQAATAPPLPHRHRSSGPVAPLPPSPAPSTRRAPLAGPSTAVVVVFL
ncbi:hypothetical protein ACFXI8_06345 [Streptomyces niveus]|uniref:hypothetical protein n=1 Tax=Streptomyces niveus TaxID=193462 RepID=UPI003679F7F9